MKDKWAGLFTKKYNKPCNSLFNSVIQFLSICHELLEDELAGQCGYVGSPLGLVSCHWCPLLISPWGEAWFNLNFAIRVDVYALNLPVLAILCGTLGKYICITAAVFSNYVSICSMFKSTLLTFDYKVRIYVLLSSKEKLQRPSSMHILGKHGFNA